MTNELKKRRDISDKEGKSRAPIQDGLTNYLMDKSRTAMYPFLLDNEYINGASLVFKYKESSCNTGDPGSSISGSGRSPGEENCLSILAWRIPWTEEPGRLQSMGSQRVRHD